MSTNEEIKLTRDEERAIDQWFGPDFKRRMLEYAQLLSDLMAEFPMAQGHSREARYLQQPFYLMSGALHLIRRFAMTEEERDEDDAITAAIPDVLDRLANAFSEKKGGDR